MENVRRSLWRRAAATRVRRRLQQEAQAARVAEAAHRESVQRGVLGELNDVQWRGHEAAQYDEYLRETAQRSRLLPAGGWDGAADEPRPSWLARMFPRLAEWFFP